MLGPHSWIVTTGIGPLAALHEHERPYPPGNYKSHRYLGISLVWHRFNLCAAISSIPESEKRTPGLHKRLHFINTHKGDK
jgi:hypothetical protein